MASKEPALLKLIGAIVDGDDAVVDRLLAASPELARARIVGGATRVDPQTYFLEQILHYIYTGDTALHLAAAAYRAKVVRKLIALGADVAAQNRRGAVPLHYAVDGGPDAAWWNPKAQAATIGLLLEAGADANALDKGGVAPIHRAARNRCASAVLALLEGGADPRLKNKSGSTARVLVTQSTGRGGVGSPAAKAQQLEILRLLGG